MNIANKIRGKIKKNNIVELMGDLRKFCATGSKFMLL